MRRTCTLALAGFLLSTNPVWAHGGHDDGPSLTSPEMPGEHSEFSSPEHEGHAEPEESVTYGLEEPEEPEGEGTYGLEPEVEDHSMHQEDPTDPSLFENPLGDLSSAPPETSSVSEHSMEGHAQHVEPATYKSVSGDAPGRGMAVGITVFSGLVFGLLCLIRPFEK